MACRASKTDHFVGIVLALAVFNLLTFYSLKQEIFMGSFFLVELFVQFNLFAQGVHVAL